MAMNVSAALRTGAKMPLVGLGTWQAPAGEVGKAVSTALAAGYRHIDCAACYGNEAEVGASFAAAFAGGVKREEVFITGKLWNSEHIPANVRPACEQTLADLKLDYLDLYLIHWPQNFQKVEGTTRGFPRTPEGGIIYDMDTTIMDTWAAMEKLVEAGLVKAIGLSNFNSVQIAEIMEKSTIKPAVLQVESHPFFTQEPLIDFCKGHDIVVTAYAPLGTGSPIDGATIPTHPKLAEIGKAHGKSAAQVAIAFQVNRGVPTFPKSVTESRIKQNLDVMVQFSAAEMAAIGALNQDLRTGWGGPKVERNGGMEPRDLLHPYYPFRPEVKF